MERHKPISLPIKDTPTSTRDEADFLRGHRVSGKLKRVSSSLEPNSLLGPNNSRPFDRSLYRYNTGDKNPPNWWPGSAERKDRTHGVLEAQTRREPSNFHAKAVTLRRFGIRTYLKPEFITINPPGGGAWHIPLYLLCLYLEYFIEFVQSQI